MTKAEWVLWITSTVFQGVIAWQVIWEHAQLRKVAKQSLAAQQRARSTARAVEPEVIN